FRFGPDICYGQSVSGWRAPAPTGDLYDAAPEISTDVGVLRVPFHPSQVVDNFRLERYATDSGSSAAPRRTAWHGLYYSFRRFMPDDLRRAVQRMYFRDWKKLVFPRWPVDDTVDRILERL